MTEPRFGPAGNSESFAAAGFKKSEDAPAWLAQMGLTAFEYQCGRGVRCGEETALKIGAAEKQRGIRMIQRPANLQRMDKALPVFFIAGRSDPVGNMGRGVEKAAAAFRAAGMQDVTCKLYDGRHEILNEKDRQLVYDDVLAFYERHLD